MRISTQLFSLLDVSIFHLIPMKYFIFLMSIIPLTIAANPRISSWFTENSGQYARLYETVADESVQNTVTVWSRGQGAQVLPSYADIHEISYSNDWVYIRSTGLASHIMGPWYLNVAKTNLFPNFPANRSVLYRVPLNPTVPVNKVGTGLGTIGRYVNGVSMFDARDAFSYSNVNATDSSPNNGITGDDIWNRDAYVNESVTFDAGNAHQAGSNYHYHANPPALRHQLGDSVDYDAATNRYTENFNSSHSPILGWAADGFPVYGPYGHSDANDASSSIRRMLSGYQKRDGSNGTANLNVTGRTTLPTWAASFQNINANLSSGQYGPSVSSAYPIGHYIEDYDFVNLGDLDQHNGRQCVTPEFPGGTYAYFITVEADGTPVFPYAIGREFYGDPTGGDVNSITEVVTLHFEGGAETEMKTEEVAYANDEVTLTWSVVDGGSYTIESSSTLQAGSWQPIANNVTPSEAEIVMTEFLPNNTSSFYRVRKTAVAPYDDSGFVDTSTFSVTYTFQFPASPALPDTITSLSVGGLSASFSYFDAATGVLIAHFDEASLAVGRHAAVINGSYTSSNTYAFGVRNNVLLLIVDDWGTDASPFDNPAGAVLPNLPTMQTIADQGLRFTRAHAQPLCSPTRATILTGRHPFRHGVGNPSSNGTLASAELTLPEIFTAQLSPYALASYGKWHLGGTASGPLNLGGWTEFAGIQGGGVASYTLWDKLENGSVTNDVTTYTTTDQVNEGIDFVTAQGSNPWFLWMGFNAPHTPFHDPPSNLAPPGGYSTSGSTNHDRYIRALEALDSEIGRLLAQVDLNTTNVIIIGDNGTPNQVVQAPFGNGNSKGDLYQGGIHVPCLIAGPDVHLTGTSDKLVHCIDLFSTILDLAGINQSVALPSITIDSNSLVPILQGTDTGARCVIAEQFGNGSGDGRAIISSVYPDYKLIIFGDKDDNTDTPTFELYHLPSDANEQTDLLEAALSAEAQAAYNHLLAKDSILGGGYSDAPVSSFDTIYLELPNITGPASPPGNLNVDPTSITIDGQVAIFVARENSAGTAERYWVECTLAPATGGPFTSATVTFPDNPNTGDPRSFNATQIIVNP